MAKSTRLAMIQFNVSKDKNDNLQRMAAQIRKVVKESNPRIVALPECWQMPFHPRYAAEYSEPVPDGPTCQLLSSLAKELNIYIAGGSIAERDGTKCYNTATVFAPSGKMIGKYRKIHLYMVDIKGDITFNESEGFSTGSEFCFVDIDGKKVGIGICNDIRYDEFVRVFRNEGCDLIIFPFALVISQGKANFETVLRCRALDNQMFVCGVSGARDENSVYVQWGHSMLVSPWGQIVKEAGEREETVVVDVDWSLVEQARSQVLLSKQRRTDLYETINKTK